MVYKDNNKKARYGESLIYQKLTEAGINVTWMAFTNKRGVPDFITDDGKMIDVKITNTRQSKNGRVHWGFNCHHHAIKQNNIDFFICIINDTSYFSIFVFPNHLLIGKNFIISERQLIRGKYDYFVENWNLIKENNGGFKDFKKRMKNKRRIESKMEKKTYRQKTDEQYILEGKNPSKRRTLHHQLANKGFKHSEKTRANMSEARKKYWDNIPPSERSVSEETKRKMSEAHKGLPGPWKGKRHSDETKRKISEFHKLRHQKNKQAQPAEA